MGTSASLALFQLQHSAIVPYTRSPLQFVCSPCRADAGSRDGSCWIQPYLGTGLTLPLGSAATVLGQQSSTGPKQGTPAPSWALQTGALEHPPQHSKLLQMSLKQGHILEGPGPLLLPPHTDVLLRAGPAEPKQRRGSWGWCSPTGAKWARGRNTKCSAVLSAGRAAGAPALVWSPSHKPPPQGPHHQCQGGCDTKARGWDPWSSVPAHSLLHQCNECHLSVVLSLFPLLEGGGSPSSLLISSFPT